MALPAAGAVLRAETQGAVVAREPRVAHAARVDAVSLHVALVWALGRRGAVRAGPARIADTDAVVAVALAVAAGWTGNLRHEGVGPGGAGRHGQHEPAPRAGSAPHDNAGLRHSCCRERGSQ